MGLSIFWKTEDYSTSSYVQERCMNSQDCSDEDVTVVITNQGSNDRADFIMNKEAFRKLAQSTYAASSMLPQGIVDIEHRAEVMQSSLQSNLNQQYQAALAAGFQSVGSGDALKQQLLQFRQPVQYLQHSGTHTP